MIIQIEGDIELSSGCVIIYYLTPMRSYLQFLQFQTITIASATSSCQSLWKAWLACSVYFFAGRWFMLSRHGCIIQIEIHQWEKSRGLSAFLQVQTKEYRAASHTVTNAATRTRWTAGRVFDTDFRCIRKVSGRDCAPCGFVPTDAHGQIFGGLDTNPVRTRKGRFQTSLFTHCKVLEKYKIESSTPKKKKTSLHY